MKNTNYPLSAVGLTTPSKRFATQRVASFLFPFPFFLLPFIFYLSPSPTTAQAPDYIWAKREGGSSDDRGHSIAVDASGNTYVTGYFYSSTITFGSTTLTNASAVGTGDIFIVKYDAAGAVLWAKNEGGSSYERGYSIAVDASVNTYVTGYFESATIAFGSTTLTNAGSYDIFIVKYDAAGAALWAKSAGGSSNDEGTSIAVDASGNCYVTGSFRSATITFGSTTLTNAGGSGIFIVKYDASGAVLWAKSAGGSSDDVGEGIAVDASGNSYVTGYFGSATITFGSTTLTNASAFGTSDIFIVKYAPSGAVLWTKRAGGSSTDYSNSIAVDASGNSYITGGFASSTITFGSTIVTNTNAGYADVFIVKYDASGAVLWAKNEGGSSYERGYSIAVDASGNSYVTGSFGSATITFGSTTLTNASAGGYEDIFIVKYDGSGAVLWAKRAGESSSDIGRSITVDASGNSYVTGYFQGATLTFGSTTLTNAGSLDMFIAKLNSTSAIENIENTYNISVEPNPTTGKVAVRSSSGSSSLNSIEVYNLLGEKIYQSQIIYPKSEIDLSDKPNGIYFLTVKEENYRRGEQKLIIVK